MKTAGVLIVKHKVSKFFYICKSDAINTRERVHRFWFTRRVYFIPELQKLFDADPDIQFEIYPAESSEDARRIERDFLAMEINNHKCLNNDWVKPEALSYALRLAKRRKISRNKTQEEEEEHE